MSSSNSSAGCTRGKRLSSRAKATSRCVSVSLSSLQVRPRSLQDAQSKFVQVAHSGCHTPQPDSSSPGDLYIIVRPLPHPTFTLVDPPPRRTHRPADLTTTLSLTLSESILGFSRLILVHLDGRGLRASVPGPGQRGWRVLKTGDQVVIPSEGMWRKGERGDLIVNLEVEMPSEEWAMGLAERGGVETLRGLLPPRRPDLAKQAVEEGKETDEVELLERRERSEDQDDADQDWVSAPFYLRSLYDDESKLLIARVLCGLHSTMDRADLTTKTRIRKDASSNRFLDACDRSRHPARTPTVLFRRRTVYMPRGGHLVNIIEMRASATRLLNPRTLQYLPARLPAQPDLYEARQSLTRQTNLSCW